MMVLSGRSLADDLAHIARHRAKVLRRTVAQGRAALDEVSVHALRVAARRLLPVLDLWRAGTGHHARRVRTLARTALDLTGPLRDAQVRRLAAQHHHGAVVAGRNKLLRRMAKDERHERRNARKHLPGLDLGALAHPKQRFGPDQLGGGARRGMHDALTRTLARLRARLRKQWRAFRTDDPATFHHARVELKRYRYFITAFRAHLPAHTVRTAMALKVMQTVLGRLHDDQQLLAWLRSLHDPPLAWMAELQQRSARRMRHFLRAHRKLML